VVFGQGRCFKVEFAHFYERRKCRSSNGRIPPMALQCSEIQQLLAAALNDAEIEVLGDGGKYQVTIVSPMFEGLNRVKRQQSIYKVLNSHIQTGAIHAVSMVLHTPQEAAVRN
jgi:acid stress-induced BolA-like protein IbaG/YrbA